MRGADELRSNRHQVFRSECNLKAQYHWPGYQIGKTVTSPADKSSDFTCTEFPLPSPPFLSFSLFGNVRDSWQPASCNAVLKWLADTFCQASILSFRRGWSGGGGRSRSSTDGLRQQRQAPGRTLVRNKLVDPDQVHWQTVGRLCLKASEAFSWFVLSLKTRGPLLASWGFEPR